MVAPAPSPVRAPGGLHLLETPPRLSPWLSYLLAPAATLLVGSIQYLLLPARPSIAPFVFFYVGVVLVSWLGGRGPGLVTVLLSALMANYVFMAPRWTSIPEPAVRATVLYVVTATTVALLCSAFRDAVLRARETDRILRRQASLLELSHDAILLWNPFTGIEAWNRGAADLYGYSAAEALSRLPHQLLQTMYPQPRAEIEALLREHGQWDGELTHTARDGRRVVVSTKMQWMAGEDGSALVLETDRDITERKQADEALERRELRFRTLVEHLSTGVALLRPDGRFVLVNDAFRRLFGIEPDFTPAALGDESWQAAELLTEDGTVLSSGAASLREAIRLGRLVRGRLLGVRLRPDQVPRWVLLGVAPLAGPGGAVEQVICTFHDITDRKRAEDELREADRRKTEFLAVLSHELRNPLAPIRNSLYLLDRTLDEHAPQRRPLRIIDRQVEQLTRLVNDLLDVNRIARGKILLNREVLALDEVARRAADDLRDLFEMSGVRLELDLPAEPVRVGGDRTRLAQVVANLLHNAAKFTPRGGWARLSVHRLRGDAVIVVSDNGHGIEQRLVARMFDSFVQGERTLDRARGGLGLGLALVRGLIELHGGRVGLASDGPGRGTTVTVHLPLRLEEAPVRESAEVGGAVKPRRILVIEDNTDAAVTLKEALELSGHTVDIALTGPEGLAKARATEPEVILCDIGLPGIDGYEIARALRMERRFDPIPLIALSGYALPADIERSAEAGFDCHLAKPPEIQKLEHVLAGLAR